MDISKKVKKRSANFTNNEKLLLIEIVSKYKDIVENKKTDNVTTAQKTDAWTKVTEEFNSSGALCHRDTECLKRAYDNRKKLLRKSVAVQKRELYKTGGGPPINTKKEPGDELLLAIVNEKTVHGLSSCFGGDNEYPTVFSTTVPVTNKEDNPKHKMSADDNIEIIYESNNENGEDEDLEEGIICEDNFQEYNISEAHRIATIPQTDDLLTAVPVGNDTVDSGTLIDENSNKRTWKRYKIGDLKAQPSPSLVTQSPKTPNMETSNRGSKDFARRRPRTVVKALTTSELSEKYNLLLDERLEIAKYQKELLKNRIEFEKMEHNLRVEALKNKSVKKDIP